MNFTLREIIHSDFKSFPEELVPIAYIALGYAQALRDALGVPLVITSGFRSAGYNSAIGGAKNSHHIWRWEGETPIFALDLTSPSLSAMELFEKLKPLVRGETYLHQKLQFVHISPQAKDEEWIQ